MSAQSEHLLAAWMSPSYPVGAFAYSHGLETAISEEQITSADDLGGWLDRLLEAGGPRADAIFLTLAHTAPDFAARDALAAEVRAFAQGRERLLETDAQGTAFAATSRAVWPDRLGKALGDWPYPVAVGAAAARMGVDRDAACRLYLHGVISALIAAAVRFMPLGQTEGQRLLAARFAPIDALVEESRHLTLADVGGHAIMADLAALRHETQTTRIFRT
ncbi:urease accessory protein UreF [Oceanomicrobium pacificus]|uniref:Urease accessory protein UreF n=1 Tax=Oceanomicrobium pacificus TaxID=2692916 RepID=A0A6B0TWN3_9RHOB|nr:urease accessory UreF family protein [Oceanomicrobium pacificus]MXU65908.1 urease accessory protein UreF [Oceanomicrobium pacificus]